MRYIIGILILIVIICSLPSCAAEDKTIDGTTYGTYGIFNESEMKNPNIRYEISTGSVVISIIFCETIIIPIYFVGWDLFQPVGKINPNWVKGQIK